MPPVVQKERPTRSPKGPIATRMIALRRRRGMTQAQAAVAAGLTREEVAKVETGKNKLTTDRMLSGLATAYRVPQAALSAYVREEMSLESLIDRTNGDAPSYVRTGNIEAAVSYHEDRWHDATIQAAKRIALTMGKDDVPPEEWTRRLDTIEDALVGTGLMKRRR